MTDKPSPATCEVPHHDCDEQQADGDDICTKCGRKARVHIRSRYFSGRFVRGRKGLASIGDDEVLDLRDKILPSSCSSSHQEIRYTGDKCPLCEALDVLRECRHWVCRGLERQTGADETLAALDAIVSRPSEAPGAGEEGKQ